jgi:hypothetical protein
MNDVEYLRPDRLNLNHTNTTITMMRGMMAVACDKMCHSLSCMGC